MAATTNKRSFPNDYFAWYTDSSGLAIVWLETSSDSSSGTTAGEYDTYSDSDVTDGIRITYDGHYTAIGAYNQLMSITGLEQGLYPALVCYVKSRLYEDLGEFEKALYFRQMFKRMYSKYPSSNSGVRQLSVPRL